MASSASENRAAAETASSDPGRPSLRPFAGWPRPDRAQARADAVAGVTVAVVAIPQALAYAQLAGVPPHIGLYAAFVPTIVGAMFGASAQLSTGPVALTALLTAASLGALAASGSAAYVALASLLAIGAGLLQAGAGLARFGRLVQRLPASLMLGFANGAALVIVLSQLPAMLGVALPAGLDVPRALLALASGLGAANLATAAFGVATFVAMLAIRPRWPRAPGALLVAIAAIGASAAIGYEAIGPVVGDLPSGLPWPSWPSFDARTLLALLPAMAVIALVSFVEAMSSARVIAARTGAAWNADQELVGQGFAKIASGLFGAFPVSASFSRSALNLEAGARTAWSSVVTALIVGVALLAAARALHHLPIAVLAGLIVSTVANLLTPREMVGLWRASRGDAAIAWVTMIATLLTAPAIHYGLIAGLVVVAIRALLRRRRARGSAGP